jgi:hypothetical protein
LPTSNQASDKIYYIFFFFFSFYHLAHHSPACLLPAHPDSDNSFLWITLWTCFT